MTAPLDQRRSLLTVALSLSVKWQEPTTPPLVQEFRGYLDSWRGLGEIVAGMTRQGYELVLQQYPTGWWANFFLSAPTHTVSAGTGWAATAPAAVQAAAWRVLSAARPPGSPGLAVGPSEALRNSPPAAAAAPPPSTSRRGKAPRGAE